MTKLKELKSKIEKLPPEAINDLGTYVELLIKSKGLRNPVKLNQKWAGGLRNLKKTYTSLKLQKKALEWRKS